MKKFNISPHSIGRAKYVVNSYDGQKTHPDGSPFWDMHIAKNKKQLWQIVKRLQNEGYVESTWTI